ncbi:MAG TPA: helix-turn-helix transcriptional regulator [Paucimonas sp.]|nr:helix-turn-helix transcriptional regulator [Paucimonas sp.]
MDSTTSPRRLAAVETAIAALDTPFFKALQEPVRLAVLCRLLLLGRADISQIAEGLPQERSVVSRHLQVLRDAGIVVLTREGRHSVYEVDGPAVLQRFETIMKQLAAIAPYCCPGNAKK